MARILNEYDDNTEVTITDNTFANEAITNTYS